MITTNDFDLAIQYYVNSLKKGPKNDKLIQNSINQKFTVSGATVRAKLIADGVIKVEQNGYDAKRMRPIHMARLVDESKVQIPEPKPVKITKTRVIETHWPEGWAKSHNNAFDWERTAKGLFSRQELAAMQAKIKSNPHFTQTTNVYSRA